MRTPVVFFVFNRPSWTALSFEEIRRARPRRLMIIADGPREGHLEDVELCAKVRSIVGQVDWDCDVKRSFADKNLGCGKRVSSGLEWVFTEVEEAIILEDDCIPNQAFFPFCEELLERYRWNERVGFIGGVSFQPAKGNRQNSYYFSRGHYIWGWASWRRAWKDYDFDMKIWPQLREKGWLHTLFQDKRVVRYYTYNFNKTYKHEIDTWDFQWFFHCWIHRRLEIMPRVNLVCNIGHDKIFATHTRFRSSVGNVPAVSMPFPLVHSERIEVDLGADRYNERVRRLSLFALVHIVSKIYEYTTAVRGRFARRFAAKR